MGIMFVYFIVYNESTVLTEVCVGLQNSMDLGETVPSVCSETCLTVSADRSAACDIKVEEVLATQEEEDPLAIALPAIKAEHEVRISILLCSDYSPGDVWSWVTVLQRNSQCVVFALLKSQHTSLFLLCVFYVGYPESKFRWAINKKPRIYYKPCILPFDVHTVHYFST